MSAVALCVLFWGRIRLGGGEGGGVRLGRRWGGRPLLPGGRKFGGIKKYFLSKLPEITNMTMQIFFCILQNYVIKLAEKPRRNLATVGGHLLRLNQ